MIRLGLLPKRVKLFIGRIRARSWPNRERVVHHRCELLHLQVRFVSELVLLHLIVHDLVL
jgi:hypothetical protein